MKKIVYFFILLGCVACQKEQEPSLYFELKDINELVLAEVRVEKTFVIDDPDIHLKDIGSKSGVFVDIIDWVKRKTSVGKRIGIYSFGTYYSAYIDLTDLSPEDITLDKKEKLCSIHLPPVRIREWGRDFELKTEHERVSLYRTPLTPQEKAKAKNEASRLLAEEVEKNGELKQKLIHDAKAKAQAYFDTLLADWGYQADIHFREDIR